MVTLERACRPSSGTFSQIAVVVWILVGLGATCEAQGTGRAPGGRQAVSSCAATLLHSVKLRVLQSASDLERVGVVMRRYQMWLLVSLSS